MDVAIVTGASSGLGAEIVTLLRDSMSVIGVSRRGPDIEGDASKRETAVAALEEAKRRGALRLLVNCAGVGIYKPVGEYSDEDIMQTLDANLLATIIFCEAVAPRFMRDGGTIVNVLSTAAMTGKPRETIYCAAKWGARGYTEALRAEAKGSQARIIAVYPGGMNTPFWPNTREDFMPAREVAAVIVDAIRRPQSIAVSDLVITRP